jgi:DNA polymerase-3 subunit epsilon|tara:strand:- start:114 stop:782 length:669 start_codon:yes stop_codon:yes gene_type:complete
MNEIFLDTETTGLSLKENHRIVEIACIETKDLIPTKNFFHKLINPDRDVPEDAVKVHGFTGEFLKDKDKFEKIADELINFIAGKKIIIHNAPFDLGFINHELKLIKKNEIKKDNVIDTLEIARGKYPGSSNSLDGLCKRFNIDLSRRVKHNAILDCELLREVYINLLDVKEPKLFFNEKDEDNTKEDEKINLNYCKKIIKPSAEELTKHKNFLKNDLKKNFY